MANIGRVIRGSVSTNILCKLFSNVTITSNSLMKCPLQNNHRSILITFSSRNVHTTPRVCGLMDFFDDKKNWGENEVKTGRSWRKDELRIKSNTDLHKLWYVLLKEHNMLLTMEQECADKTMLFPSPERLDKVRDSMRNLEDVVRERNKAYHLLETGVTGERPSQIVQNELGFKYRYRQTEHLIPKELNSAWRKTHNFNPRGNAVNKFLLHYHEKLYNEKRKRRNRDRNHVIGLLKRFPNLDRAAVKAQYPDVNIDKCLENRKARGHFVPK